MKRHLTRWRNTAGCMAITLICHTVQAQEQQPPALINSGDLIKQGVKHYEQHEYKQALALYKQVPPGDTNYVAGLQEQVMTYLADTNYLAAKQLATEALRLPDNMNRREFLLYKGHAHDYLGETDSALACYDLLTSRNPWDHQPYFERATVYARNKRYDQAIGQLKKSLMVNPYHFRSHYLLGVIYMLQGRLTESYLALCTSLFTSNDASAAEGAIGNLGTIAKQEDELNKAYRDRDKSLADPAYEEIDQIINSKLALSKAYTYKSVLAGDKVVSVLHAIMEKLSYEAADTNFVMQYYVPLYTNIFKNGQFDPMALLMFSGYGIEVVDKLAEKNKKEIQEAREQIFPYLDRIVATQTLNYEQRKNAAERYMISTNEKIFIVGTPKSKKPLAWQGPIVYYKNYVLTAEGNYNNEGKKEGLWKYYYTNGSLSSEEHYKNGENSGSNTFYYSNGNVRQQYQLDEQGKQLEKREYAYNGLLTAVTKPAGDDSNEVTLYHPNGSVQFKGYANKEDDLKDGHFRYFYDNGQVSKDLNILNGKRNGLYKEYYSNGQLAEDCTYKNSEKEGAYISYYRNGAVHYKINYKADAEDGIGEEYSDEGKLVEKTMLAGGKRNGPVEYYAPDGRHYGTVTYKAGVPVAYGFKGEDGKMLDTLYNTNGLDKVIIYYPNGNKRGETAYNKDKESGPGKFFYATGTIQRALVYKDRKLNGTSTEYYRNGNVSNEINFTDNEQDGYYRSYHANGKKQAEGWLKKDKKQGTWYWYNSDGRLEHENYYLDDEQCGPQYTYLPTGHLSYTDVYDKDMLIGLIEYDTAGRERRRVYFPQGNGTYQTTHIDGKPHFTVPLKYGQYHGLYTRQLPDGRITEKGYFRNGQYDSTMELYTPTGQLTMKSSLRQGKREGVLRLYNEDGVLRREQQYVNGELDGGEKIWEAGKLRYEQQYHNGKRNGDQMIYTDSNRIACVLHYEEGVLTGYTYTGKDGKLLPVTPVKNGTCTIAASFADGKRSAELRFKEGFYDGEQTLYYSNGQKAEERHYARTDLNGSTKKWLPNGKPTFECQYQDDENTGQELTYDSMGNLIATVNYASSGVLHGPSTYTDAKTKKTVTVTYYYGQVTGIK